MLDVIRGKAQSWGVKIAFAIIILVFVFWGVGSFTGGPASVILKVNGEPITIQAFQARYEQFERSVRAQQPDLDNESIKNLHLRKQLIDSMILEELLQQEAKRVGLTVTPMELRQVIEDYPAFHNAQGKFDANRYLEVLKAQRETPGNFEENVRGSLLINKLRLATSAGAAVCQPELRNLFAYEGERRAIEYVLYPSVVYQEKVDASPEEIQAYYDANQVLYSIPPRANLEYLLVGAASIADPASVKDADIAAFYEKHLDQYAYPEQFRARHILIMADDKAPAEIHETAKAQIADIAERLKAGEDFAELAKEFSQDGSASNGGDLGWFAPAQMVAPFATAVQALQPGEISGVVQTQFGYHLIKLEEKKAAGTTPLDEVQDSIRTRLAQEEAAGRVQDVLEQAQLAVIGGQDLAQAGASIGLVTQQTGLINTTVLGQTLGLKPDTITTILSAAEGTTLETPFMTKDGYLLVKVVESRPQTQQTLDEVKEQIITEIRAGKSRTMALTEAKAARATFTESAPEGIEARTQKSDFFGHNGYVPGLGTSQELTNAAFAAKPGEWLEGAFAVDGGAILARLAEVNVPDEEMWKVASAQLTGGILDTRRNQMFGQLLELLKASAKIEVLNATVFND